MHSESIEDFMVIAFRGKESIKGPSWKHMARKIWILTTVNIHACSHVSIFIIMYYCLVIAKMYCQCIYFVVRKPKLYLKTLEYDVIKCFSLNVLKVCLRHWPNVLILTNRSQVFVHNIIIFNSCTINIIYEL